VETIRTEGEHLDVALAAFPSGPQEALAQIRNAF
jgi:hypothetical protein